MGLGHDGMLCDKTIFQEYCVNRLPSSGKDNIAPKTATMLQQDNCINVLFHHETL